MRYVGSAGDLARWHEQRWIKKMQVLLNSLHVGIYLVSEQFRKLNPVSGEVHVIWRGGTSRGGLS
jgi:hypothetical protein